MDHYLYKCGSNMGRSFCQVGKYLSEWTTTSINVVKSRVGHSVRWEISIRMDHYLYKCGSNMGRSFCQVGNIDQNGLLQIWLTVE